MSPRRSLRERWQRLRTVPGLGRDVTALAVLVALGLAAAGYLLTYASFTPPWAQRFEFKVELADAVSVSPGNSQEVRIAGVPVGLITASEPTDHHTSLVTLRIEPGHPIYDNAHVVLRPVNPLNQMYITLNPGAPPAKELPEGGVIPLAQTSRPVQPDEVLDKLDDRSRVALTSLLAESDNALANAPQTLGPDLKAADKSLKTLRPVVERLKVRHDNIQKLITALADISSALGHNDARLTSLVDSTQATLRTLAQRDAELSAALRELPGTTDELRTALDKTSELTHELNPALDNLQAASDELPGALSSVTDMVDPLRDTVHAAESVVSKAKEIVKDLRPITRDLREAFDDLAPVTGCLDEYTAKVAPWMYDLGAFTYNTNSMWSGSDKNGGFGRGHVTIHLTGPLGAQRPGEQTTNKYQDAPSPIGQYPAKGSGECR
ncbi:MCE family protein [Pseudonocardia acaciae]|uniref:MCE family protein n=1 Tax=Pseudonocardia acaciae TaxID=551276 RepID=UPI0007E8C25E|nr:MCE family protein [Pseudonocardia acaciae]